MPDPRFYSRAGPFSSEELARRCGAVLAEGCDPAKSISDVGDAKTAGSSDIIYVADAEYLEQVSSSKCGACIITEEFFAKISPECVGILAPDPRIVFARVASLFYPEEQSKDLNSTDQIASDAIIGEGVDLAPGVVIGSGADIGEGTQIGANAVIGPGVILGKGCKIGPNVTVTHAILGLTVRIAAGSQIGQDGFGFVPTKTGHVKIPQLGRVLIGDNVDVGANCAIDRGALGDTVVGAGTKIDNLVQIGHNVEIGRDCVIVSQVGISGSCRIGNGVVIGGQGGLADHVTIGDGAQVAAKSGIMRDIAPGDTVMGYPAKPIRQFWREIAALTRLTNRGK